MCLKEKNIDEWYNYTKYGYIMVLNTLLLIWIYFVDNIYTHNVMELILYLCFAMLISKHNNIYQS